MTFKPMLAGNCTDVSALAFPVLASTKLDGVRATVQGGQLLTRSLKPIPNYHVQMMFRGLPERLDGELIYGDPTHPEAYRRTVSIVMSEGGPATGVRFHVFDKFGSEGFEQRLSNAWHELASHARFQWKFVNHVRINNREELDALEAAWLAEGHEGVMLRSLHGPYKQGRSTEREGYLLKLKQFKDSEALVLDTYEMMHNDNAATINELGHTEHSSHKVGMRPAGVLGGLHVRDLSTGVEFDLGGGYTAALRAELWAARETLPGRIAKYKFFPTGSKDKPRFPVWMGWRDERDM